MFFSAEVLSIKSNSKLGVVWIAATLGPKSATRKLGRRDLSVINIPETCHYLADPPQAWSLRLTSSMMVGVTRVYGQQCSYQYQDVQQFCSRITKLQISTDLDMQPSNARNTASITIGKVDTLPKVGVLNDMTLPDLDIATLLKAATDGYGTPEQGRKDKEGILASSSSSLSKPFYASSSSRLSSSDSFALQSDLIGTTAFPDTNFDDNLFADGAAFPVALNLFQRRDDAARTASLEVPDVLHQAAAVIKSRKRRSTINYFDSELMLDKEHLFLNDHEIMTDYLKAAISGKASRETIINAINLITTPTEDMIEGLTGTKLDFHFTIPPLTGKNNTDFEHFNDDDSNNFHMDAEAYRSGNNNVQIDLTPSTKHMPWSSIPGSDIDFNRRSSSDLSMQGLILSGSSSPTRSHSSIASNTAYPSFFTSLPENIKASTVASRDTLDFLHFCQERTNERSKTSFFSLINRQTESRHVAANAFSHILQLTSANLMQVRQVKPHGDIELVVC